MSDSTAVPPGFNTRANSRMTGSQVRNVRERERTGDDIDRCVVDRELLEPADAESRPSGTLLAGDGEHRFGRVDADHAMTQLGELGRVTAGAARGVERDARGRRVEHRVHQRLLAFDGRVRTVVAAGPAGVALVDVVLDHRDRQRVRELVHGRRDVQHLVDPWRDRSGSRAGSSGQRQTLRRPGSSDRRGGCPFEAWRFLARRSCERTWVRAVENHGPLTMSFARSVV